MAAWKSRTSQPQNVLHDGGRHAACQQSAGDPQVHDAPIWVWKSLPYAQALRPGLVDLSGLRGGQARWSSPLPRRGGGLHTGRRCVAAPGNLLATGPQQTFGVAGQTGSGVHDFHPGRIAVADCGGEASDW